MIQLIHLKFHIGIFCIELMKFSNFLADEINLLLKVLPVVLEDLQVSLVDA
jgi:hypothetical protein